MIYDLLKLLLELSKITVLKGDLIYYKYIARKGIVYS